MAGSAEGVELERLIGERLIEYGPRVDVTCLACPLQVELRFEGFFVYFRARGGSVSCGVDVTADGAVGASLDARAYLGDHPRCAVTGGRPGSTRTGVALRPWDEIDAGLEESAEVVAEAVRWCLERARRYGAVVR